MSRPGAMSRPGVMKNARVRRVALGLMLIVLLIIVAWVYLPRDPGVGGERTEYIDLHVHTAGLGMRGSGAFINEEMRASLRYPIYLHAFGVTEEDLETHGDGFLIDSIAASIARSKRVTKAVVLAMDGVIEDGRLMEDKTQIFVPNAFVAQATARHDELLFGASINPNRHDAIERLREAHRAGAVLVKWLPNIMHIDPANRAHVPFYEELIRLDLPLLTHAGQERSFETAIDAYGDPERLHLPLSLGVKVIAAHIASTGRNRRGGQFRAPARNVRGVPEPLRRHLESHPGEQARLSRGRDAAPRDPRPARFRFRLAAAVLSVSKPLLSR